MRKMLLQYKYFLVLFFLGIVFSTQAYIWHPTHGHRQIEIWPKGKMPDAQLITRPESAEKVTQPLVAGKSWIAVGPVSTPTMTVYSPNKKNNTGIAMVVFPGGGYWILAIDLEGTEVCHWLVANGITCVLSKYRVPGENAQGGGLKPRSGPYPDSPLALEDAQRTISLVRYHAKKWYINPDKIGVIGFSAGGHLVAAVSTLYNRRIYKHIDKIDDVSSRPDFGIALYPGHLWLNHKKFVLNPDVPVSRNTPPTFIVQAEDDDVDSVNNSLVYYRALKQAGVPVEMHLYAHGGHAFGLRRTRYAITRWPNLVMPWLVSIGILNK